MTATAEKIEDVRAFVERIIDQLAKGLPVNEVEMERALAAAKALPEYEGAEARRKLRGESESRAVVVWRRGLAERFRVVAPLKVEPPAPPSKEIVGSSVDLRDWVSQKIATGRALVPVHAQLPVELRQPITSDIELPIVCLPLEAAELMNRKFAHIGNYGGKPQVLSWERWIVNPALLIPSFQSMDNFKNRYPNRFVEEQMTTGNGTVFIKRPLGEWWLRCPGAASFDAVAFEPNKPEVLVGNRLNLWRGFAVIPRKGSWRRLLRHIYRVLGNGDRKAGRYILRWIAWCIQNPDQPCGAILVLRGEEGTGKGTLALALKQIFGVHSLSVSDPNHLLGAFSGHLQHCVFLFLDEAFWAGNLSKVEGRLKHLVTESTILIEPKYVTPFEVANLLHMLMASNSDWVVPASRTARRYAVFDVSDEQMGETEYFNALRAEILKEGGAAAMLYDLLQMDLKGWNPMQIYQTAALVDQKRHSLRGLDRWMETILQTGMLPVPCGPKYANRCCTEDLLRDALTFDRYTNETDMNKALKKVLGVGPCKNPEGSKRARKWPELSDCRKSWDRYMHSSWDWENDLSEWQYEGTSMLDRCVAGIKSSKTRA